jgi:hypothetical protein
MSGAGYASIDAVQPEENASLERLMFSLGARVQCKWEQNDPTFPVGIHHSRDL